MLNVATQLGSWTSFHLTSSNVETWSWPRCSSMLDKVSFETGDIQFSCVFCNIFYSFSALILGRSDEHLMAFRLSHRQFFTWKLHTHFRWIWMLTYDIGYIGYIGIWSVYGLWKDVESKDSHLCTKCTSEPAWVSSSPGRSRCSILTAKQCVQCVPPGGWNSMSQMSQTLVLVFHTSTIPLDKSWQLKLYSFWRVLSYPTFTNTSRGTWKNHRSNRQHHVVFIRSITFNIFNHDGISRGRDEDCTRRIKWCLAKQVPVRARFMWTLSDSDLRIKVGKQERFQAGQIWHTLKTF